MHWPVLIPLPAHPPVDMEPNVLPGWLYWPLLTFQGIFWISAYALLIQRGAVDKSLGMPLFALALNLGWELSYVLVLPHPSGQKPFDLAWVLLDLVILWQALRYGRKDFPALSPPAFRGMAVAAVLLGAVLAIAMGYELADFEGIYSALAINVYMSWAFIALLLRRGSSAGQSLQVAASKGLGTLCVGVMFVSFYPQRWLLALLAVTILVLDLTYVVMLYRQIRAEGVSPWTLNRPPVRLPAAAGRETAGQPAVRASSRS
jgi:hypothetical protein